MTATTTRTVTDRVTDLHALVVQMIHLAAQVSDLLSGLQDDAESRGPTRTSISIRSVGRAVWRAEDTRGALAHLLREVPGIDLSAPLAELAAAQADPIRTTYGEDD